MVRKPAMPRAPIAGVCGHAMAQLSTPSSTRLEEAESTRPRHPKGRRRGLRESVSMSSIHLLHGQPTKRSDECEQERDSMHQQGCTHMPRRKRCSAKCTFRVGEWRSRRIAALQIALWHHVRHSCDVAATPAASRGCLSTTKSSSFRAHAEGLGTGCCYAGVRWSCGLRPSHVVGGGPGKGSAPSGPSADHEQRVGADGRASSFQEKLTPVRR